MVTSYYLEHNHRRSKFIFDRLPVNRRLTTEELKECSTLLKCGAPSSEIRQYVADHFGKVLTIQDVYNYRSKCRPPLLSRSVVTFCLLLRRHAVHYIPASIVWSRTAGGIRGWQIEPRLPLTHAADRTLPTFP
ncbi:hypothetical protein CLF_105024 [Clonorchis sinensis]|uniref:Uncharacterized protein n=1 Tax=Clonorchis sinensis TaxID=79923 RepID=G7YCT6_CLOSI|nr:hypothetical protein CLF_105024 [Clonorchis sinensis]